MSRHVAAVVKLVSAAAHQAAATSTHESNGSRTPADWTDADSPSSGERRQQLQAEKIAQQLETEWTQFGANRIESIYHDVVQASSAAPGARAAAEKKIERHVEELGRKLQRALEPPTEAGSTNGSHASPPRPAIPAAKVAARSSHHSASYHSLLSPLPSYDALDACIAQLASQPRSSSSSSSAASVATRQAALDAILAFAPSDLLACPQWETLLPAIAACIQTTVPTGKHNKHGSSSSGASIADQTFHLSARTVLALADLYDAAEAPAQAVDVIVASISAMKSLLPQVASSAASSPIQWLAVLPSKVADSASSSAGSAALQLPSLYFHLSRLLTTSLHRLPDTWVYCEPEVLDRVAQEVFDLFAAAAVAPVGSGGGSVAWLLLTLPDTQMAWLQRWTSNILGRRAWHSAAATASVRSGHGSIGRMYEEIWKGMKEGWHVNANLSSPKDSTSPSSSESPDVLTLPASSALALSSTACWAFLCLHCASLNHTAVTAGVATSESEHSNSATVKFTPETKESTSSSSSSASTKKVSQSTKHNSTSSAASSSSSHKNPHRSNSKKKTTGASESSSSSKSSSKGASSVPPSSSSSPPHHERRSSDLSRFPAEQARLKEQCVEFAVHVLSYWAVTSDSMEKSARAAAKSIVERARLAFIATTQHFLVRVLSHSSDPSQAMVHLLSSVESSLHPSAALSSLHHSILTAATVTTASLPSPMPSPPLQPRSLKPGGSGAAGGSTTAASHKKNRPPVQMKEDKSADTKQQSQRSTILEAPETGGPATLVQQAALTSILGIILAVLRSATTIQRSALVPQLIVPVSVQRDSSTSSSVGLFDAVCRWLSLDDDGAANSSAPRRFLFADRTAAHVSATASADILKLELPAVCETILIDILRELVLDLPTRNASSSSSSTQQAGSLPVTPSASDHRNYLRVLAARIEKMGTGLQQRNDAIVSKDAQTTTLSEENVHAIPHQQSPSFPPLLSLLSLWSSALSAGASGHAHALDALHTEHPQVVEWIAMDVRRKVKGRGEEECVPWCAACKTALADGGVTKQPSPLVALRLHTQLLQLRHSRATFLSLLRHGVFHALFHRLTERLSEEDDPDGGSQWSLAFELDEEPSSPERIVHHGHAGLWSLRLLIVLLDTPWMQEVIEKETTLLSFRTGVKETDFPCAPRPPVLLVVAHVIDHWLLQRATSPHADPPSPQSLPLPSPLSFPLPPLASPAHLPAAWFAPRADLVVASGCNAKEVACRMVCGMMHSGGEASQGNTSPTSNSVAAENPTRWWKLAEALRSNGDEDGPEDQTTRWRKHLIQQLQLPKMKK